MNKNPCKVCGKQMLIPAWRICQECERPTQRREKNNRELKALREQNDK